MWKSILLQSTLALACQSGSGASSRPSISPIATQASARGSGSCTDTW